MTGRPPAASPIAHPSPLGLQTYTKNVILLPSAQKKSRLRMNADGKLVEKLFGLSLRTTVWREYFVRPRGPKPDVALAETPTAATRAAINDKSYFLNVSTSDVFCYCSFIRPRSCISQKTKAPCCPRPRSCTCICRRPDPPRTCIW